MKKAPSTNIQAPEKLQIPNFKQRELELVAWLFSGAWMLKFGACFDVA
jgi:hypothetical protein